MALRIVNRWHLHLHVLNECAMLVLSPLRAVAAEAGGALIWAMIMDVGFGPAGLAHLGGQSAHFQ